MTMTRLTEAFSQAVAMDKDLILVDFEKNASINGAGITGLTELLKRHRATGSRIVLAGLSSNFKAVFETLGIPRLAEMFDNGEEALATQ